MAVVAARRPSDNQYSVGSAKLKVEYYGRVIPPQRGKDKTAMTTVIKPAEVQ